MTLRHILPILLFYCGLWAASLAHAQNLTGQEALYTVRGINVDIEAESAVAARDQAILRAQRQAFEQLYARLVLKEDLTALPQLSSEQLQRLVRGFEIEEERSSAIRYIARITVQFRPEPVKSLLRERGLRFAEYASPPLVVLPIYGAGQSWALWESPNFWREAWENTDRAESVLMPVLLPFGDLTDLRSLSLLQAWQREHPALRAVMNRYRAGAVLVAVARIDSGSVEEPMALTLFAYRHEQSGAETGFQLTLRRASGETRDVFFQRGIHQVLDQLQTRWKQQISIDPRAQTATLPVFMSVSGLSEWLEARKRLSGITHISQIVIDSLARETVWLNLHYRGDEGQLRQALQQAGLNLGSAPQFLELDPLARRGLQSAPMATPEPDASGVIWPDQGIRGERAEQAEQIAPLAQPVSRRELSLMAP